MPPGEGAYLARHDPAAPPVRPPCQHAECWDALAGRCLNPLAEAIDALGIPRPEVGAAENTPVPDSMQCWSCHATVSGPAGTVAHCEFCQAGVRLPDNQREDIP